jgi:RNA polymerase sigma-70 factor (ECF subfamily)
MKSGNVAHPGRRYVTPLNNTAKSPAHLQLVRDHGPDAPLDFDAIFFQYVRYVNAVAMRLLGDRGDAEDVVQEVLWSCYKHVHKIQSMTHARRWLMQVTVQKARRLLKKRKLSEAMRLSFTQALDPPAPSASAEERVAIVHLFSILQRMSVNHRLAWSLRYIEGAELNEVAEALCCSLATAKRWIAQAQRTIKGGDNG